MTRVVAIDGPAGSGKSTVARAVAAALGLEVLDTGAMYRAVTLAVLEAGADPDDAEACGAAARAARIDLGHRVRLDDRDVTEAIRGPAVTAAVSTVSAHPAVRGVLVGHQRTWAEAHGGAVVEGRDIGTVVFPNATLKVFLTASDEERARRRARDEVAADRSVDVAEVQADLARRDRLDRGRAASPLVAATDAVRVDSTDRTIDDVVRSIVDEFRRREAAA
ncbi:MAG: (d)CMP kinase [Actinomycetes bacterium]